MRDNCQECNASFIGDPIPQSDRTYRREIGYEVRGVYDGILYWACPDCGFAWVRDMHADSPIAHQYVWTHNNGRELAKGKTP